MVSLFRSNLGNAGCYVLRPLRVGAPLSVLWEEEGRKEQRAGLREEHAETSPVQTPEEELTPLPPLPTSPPNPVFPLKSTEAPGAAPHIAPHTECTRHLGISRVTQPADFILREESRRGLGLLGGTWKCSSPASPAASGPRRSAAQADSPFLHEGHGTDGERKSEGGESRVQSHQ